MSNGMMRGGRVWVRFRLIEMGSQARNTRELARLGVGCQSRHVTGCGHDAGDAGAVLVLLGTNAMELPLMLGPRRGCERLLGRSW
jgi:hypothetical protein